MKCHDGMNVRSCRGRVGASDASDGGDALNCAGVSPRQKKVPEAAISQSQTLHPNFCSMVAVAQLVEPWIVSPVVVGSRPISHPTTSQRLTHKSMARTMQL